MSLFHFDAGKEWRGGQRQSFFLAREIKKRGIPFQFVVQPGSPLHRKSLEAGLPVVELRVGNDFDILAAARLARAFRRSHCTLAHFHDAHAAAVGSLAASMASVPIRIATRRVDFPLRRNFLSLWKYRRNLDVVIALSEGVKKVLITSGMRAETIVVIPSGTDLSKFEGVKRDEGLRRQLSLKPDDYAAGIVAHLAGHKGHTCLIQAARYIRDKTDAIKILIVGEGPLQTRLMRQVEELGVGDIVRFLGFREDIPEILASLDLFVLSSFFEGFGSSILDAMACRLPVVATRTGGIPEVVVDGETGLLVPPRDPAALAEAILRLHADRETAAALGQRGYDVVHSKFTVDIMTDRILELYEAVSRRKGVKPF